MFSSDYCCPPGGDFCSLSRKAILRLLISSGSSALGWPEPEAAPEAPGLAAARPPDGAAVEEVEDGPPSLWPGPESDKICYL